MTSQVQQDLLHYGVAYLVDDKRVPPAHVVRFHANVDRDRVVQAVYEMRAFLISKIDVGLEPAQVQAIELLCDTVERTVIR